MKLSVFILLVASINCYAQQDSIAKIRKPVLECLIADHYTANKLAAENSILRNQQVELHSQIKNYELIKESYRKDSSLCDSLVSLIRTESKTWEESYELEKAAHKKTKRKYDAMRIVSVLALVIASF